METGPPTARPRLPFPVFELPMRDGNQIKELEQARDSYSFWTSYEGWKLMFSWFTSVSPSKFLNFLWGMETDCTLDILASSREFLNFLWGMETIVNTRITTVGHQFLNFLWGMETSMPSHRHSTVMTFLNFLWGMETLSGKVKFFVPKLVFELPMRDGNFHQDHVERVILWFLNFLWGMETCFAQ